jgi:diguanylate cyclase (GGDEF)-like protein
MRTGASAEISAKRMRILIGESEPDSRALLQLTLGGWGYEVELAQDGEEALAILTRDDGPRFALLDWADLSLLLLDVDHFKGVDSRHGHQAGDQALREIAIRLTGALRPYDVLGRYGGEQLLAVLPGCGLGSALAVADRMRRVVAGGRVSTGAGPLVVTISIGAAARLGKADAASLIALADVALHRAKANGRNRVEAAALQAT